MQQQEYQEVMRRKIYSQLLRWKSDDNGQNALLIDVGIEIHDIADWLLQE